MKDVKSCKTCTKYIYCWERSRMYPSIKYEERKEHDMNDRRLRHHLHPYSCSSDSSCADMADLKETAEEKLRNHVTVMLCQGTPPKQIEQEILKDRTCTAATKTQILAELHRLEVNP